MMVVYRDSLLPTPDSRPFLSFVKQKSLLLIFFSFFLRHINHPLSHRPPVLSGYPSGYPFGCPSGCPFGWFGRCLISLSYPMEVFSANLFTLLFYSISQGEKCNSISLDLKVMSSFKSLKKWWCLVFFIIANPHPHFIGSVDTLTKWTLITTYPMGSFWIYLGLISASYIYILISSLISCNSYVLWGSQVCKVFPRSINFWVS